MGNGVFTWLGVSALTGGRASQGGGQLSDGVPGTALLTCAGAGHYWGCQCLGWGAALSAA